MLIDIDIIAYYYQKSSNKKSILRPPTPMKFRYIIAIAATISLSSCQDKALVKKNEDLRQQVTELKEKISTLEAQAGEDPGDQTASLNEVNENLLKTLDELKGLDEQKQSLEEKYTQMEKDLEAYKRKYVVQ